MKAGYNFVSTTRAAAYISLAAGVLTSIGAGGYFLISGITDLFTHREARNNLQLQAEKEIAERDKELLEMKKQHEERIKNLCEKVKGDIEAVNAAGAVTLEEIAKVNGAAKQLQQLALPAPQLTDTAACTSYAEELNKALQWIVAAKDCLYSGINANYDKLTAPLQSEIDKRLAEIAKQQAEIDRYLKEIDAILTKSRTQEVPARALLKPYPLYNIQLNGVEPGPATVLDYAGDQLNLFGLVDKSDLLKNEDLNELHHSIGRLAAWLPTVINGITKREVEVKLNENDPSLTPSEKAKIEDLKKRIEGANGMIRAFEKEMKPYATQKEAIEAKRAVVLKTKEQVSSYWVVDTALTQAQNTCNSIMNEYSSYPGTIIAKTSMWNAKITSTLTEKDMLWKTDCATSCWATGIGAGSGAGILAVSWIIWALLLITMDIIAAILVTALRAQDIQAIMDKKEN